MLPVILALACALLGQTAGLSAAAKEPARGRKASVKWLDEKGASREAEGTDVVYGYYTRNYLKVPKDGKSYKDEVHEEKGIPLAGAFIAFTMIDKVEFTWQTDADADTSHMGITVTLANGKVQTGSGNALAGASHPTSPYIAFTSNGERLRIDINPLAAPADRAGKPQLVSLTILR